MLRFFPKAIVIAAAICFIGLAAMQIAWIISAYEGEVALHSKAKKQFESELQSELGQNEQLKAGLKDFLDDYNQKQRVSESQKGWFYLHFVQVIDFSPKKGQFEVYLDGISIAKHTHNGTMPRTTTLISSIYESPDSSQIEKAGKLCVDCILGVDEKIHGQYDYQILLFYKDHFPAFFEKLWFLILGSLILLVVLGFLFRDIIRKYGQEKKLSEAKNDFINNLSHEMQTPVFAIQMANKLIKEKTDGQQNLIPLTTIIEKETGQLKQHATKILELASLERGQVELTREVTELNALITQKRPTIELMLQSRGGRLDVKFHAEQLYCEIDPVHFNNILVSLADNAIKYNENAPMITIETGEENRAVYLRFSDNGIGIRREYLPYVTDKFFRVPHVKRNGVTGFGLGLSYVKHIVDLHGGAISISSEEGKGTIVTILLLKATRHA